MFQAWLFVFLVCVCVLGLTSWRLQRAYDLELHTGRAITANLARSLADQAHNTVHNAGMIVSDVVERLETDGTSDAALLRLHRILVKFVAVTPGMSDLVAVSTDGHGLATSLDPMPKVNLADRTYFIYHRDHPDRQMLVGPPIRSRADGRWSFTVSRRLDNPDGSFGGVVVGLIDCGSFSAFYRGLNTGNGSIWMMNEDGVLLVRQPAVPETVGTSFEQSPQVRAYREYGPVGSIQNASPIDGASRLSSFRKVDDFPLVIFVSLSTDDLLSGWRTDAAISLVVAVAVCAMLSVLGWRLVHQFRLRDQNDLAIRQSEQQYRLLADYSTDTIIQFDQDGRQRYVSPACERMLGYHPMDLLGAHPRDTIHPEDWPRVAANMAEILALGQAPPVSYRVRRKDGVYLWVETQGQRLTGDQGFIVAIRDITRRRHVEDLLHQANNHLQRQVMLDGLTGIANRRCFDITLLKEFRRAARSQTPLATLMIDVDHFKKFNDLYGHPAGDACLRSIAEAAVAQVRRPADLVARYGGEEFVVLLPDTDPAGAMAMAERIRLSIQSLGITHAGNPAAVATVSIGVGVGWPQTGQDDTAGLMAAADAALYRAKAAGRNVVGSDLEAAVETRHKVAPAT